MDNGIDPDVFFGLQRSKYADNLRYTPKPALVIEIYKSVVGPPYVLAAKRTPEDLEEWISTQVVNDRDGSSRPGLRLIIGGARDAEPRSMLSEWLPYPPPPGLLAHGPPGPPPGWRPGRVRPMPPGLLPPMPPGIPMFFAPPDMPPTTPAVHQGVAAPIPPPLAPSPPIPEGGDRRWPLDSQNLEISRHRRIDQCMPFSAETLHRITSSFSLPSSTHWLCQTHNMHFKTYRMRRSVIGLTARYLYIKGLDVVLSMSYCPATDITTALIIGPTVRQTEFLRAEFSRLARIAHHPALVPTLMADCVRNVVVRRVSERCKTTGSIESDWMRARTYTSVSSISTRAFDNARDLTIIETELGMLETQLAGTLEFVHLTSDGGPRSEKGKEKPRDDIVEIGAVLEERLDFVLSTITHPRLRARMFKERSLSILSSVTVPVATSSTGTLIGMRNMLQNHLNQSVKRFWWFKAVIITVITFTPGIFVATFFSTSFMAAANPPQWSFWATDVPMTVTILAAFAICILWKPPQWLRRWPDMAGWMRRLKRKIRRRFGLEDDASSTSSTSLVDDDD